MKRISSKGEPGGVTRTSTPSGRTETAQDRYGMRETARRFAAIEETHANRVADAIVPDRAAILRSPLERTRMERATGVRFEDVTLHRDKDSHSRAERLGALAFASGSQIGFARHAPSLDLAAGQWLLAHELAHVAQQRVGPPRVRAYPDPAGTFHDPDNDVVSDVPGALPGDAMDPTSGIDVDEVVSVAAPLLAGQRRRGRDRDETYHVHGGIISKTPISAYAIPRSLLSLDPFGFLSAAAPAGGSPPEVTADSLVFGPNHLPLVVLAADDANIVVESSQIIHYAVGAGSCVLVNTTDGWYMFDAGVNAHVPGTIADGCCPARLMMEFAAA